MRRLLKPLTILSLLLCAATMALSVRTHYVWEHVRIPARGWGVVAQTEPGAINTWFVPSYRWEYGNLGEYHSGLMIYDEPLAHLFGFGYGRHNGELWIKTPLWFPTLLTAILPALVVWRRTSHAGRRRGASRVCTACGYDLRATPDRCPECGKEVAPRGA